MTIYPRSSYVNSYFNDNFDRPSRVQYFFVGNAKVTKLTNFDGSRIELKLKNLILNSLDLEY